MSNILKTTVIAALLMCGTDVSMADTAKAPVEFKKDVAKAVKACKSTVKQYESYACLWSWADDALKSCQLKMSTLCNDLRKEEAEFPYKDYQNGLAEMDKHVSAEEKRLNTLIAAAILKKTDYHTFSAEITPQIAALVKDCKDAEHEINHETSDLWGLYGKMKGKTCRK